MPVNKDERVTKKKNGLFRYRVRVNYIDANGNSQQIERLAWGKAEAEAMEQELIAEYKDKHLAVSSRMTVAELVEKYEQYHAAETRASTHRNTMKNLRLRVLPYLKDQRIDRLTQLVLAEWKVAIAKENIALQTKQNA